MGGSGAGGCLNAWHDVCGGWRGKKEVRVAPDNSSENPSDQKPEASANKMDRPLPGSDGPVPNPTASGVAEPIEAAERAAGVDPGSPTPTQQAQTRTPFKEQQ